MNIKRLFVEFVTVFAVALVTTAMVTFLWNIIGQGAGVIDWETSFRFAIIFGIILTWVNSREFKPHDLPGSGATLKGRSADAPDVK